jgi:hypothetical protein
MLEVWGFYTLLPVWRMRGFLADSSGQKICKETSLCGAPEAHRQGAAGVHVYEREGRSNVQHALSTFNPSNFSSCEKEKEILKSIPLRWRRI